jgi:AP endonuclease 2
VQAEKEAVPSDPVPVAGVVRSAGSKRSQKPEATMSIAKRPKSGSQSTSTNGSGRGQQSLKGFFQARSATINESSSTKDNDTTVGMPPESTPMAVTANGSQISAKRVASPKIDVASQAEPAITFDESSLMSTIDEASAEASRKTWGKLFSKPISPKCEHGEPCKTMLTKKPGVNCGRSFWMCSRPLGPSGNKEKNTQWRCNTFIWASDWAGMGNGGSV